MIVRAGLLVSYFCLSVPLLYRALVEERIADSRIMGLQFKKAVKAGQDLKIRFV